MEELTGYYGLQMQVDPPITKAFKNGKLVWFIVPDENAFSIDKDNFCHSWFWKKDIPLHIKTLEAYYGIKLQWLN